MDMQPPMQLVANLQSKSTNWEQLTHLNGEYMQEAEYIRQAEETSQALLTVSAHWCRVKIAYYLGLYDLAEQTYTELGGMGISARLVFNSVPWFWYGAVIHYEQYRASGRRATLRKARRYKQKLKRMSECVESFDISWRERALSSNAN